MKARCLPLLLTVASLLGLGVGGWIWGSLAVPRVAVQERGPVATADVSPTGRPTRTPTQSEPADLAQARSLRIGTVDLSATLVPGAVSDGELSVPTQPGRASLWWPSGRAGSGPAVIAGHVDVQGSPGVFARLGQVPVGTLVEVRVEGEEAPSLWRVVAAATHPKGRLPPEVIGPEGPTRLQLVTCTGPVEWHTWPDGTSTREYRDNLVVTAEPLT